LKPDPALDRITAAIRAITELVTGEPPIPCVDIVDLRHVLVDAGCAVFGQGEAEGPDRAIRAAYAAIADIRRQISQLKEIHMSEGRGRARAAPRKAEAPARDRSERRTAAITHRE
jgi:hypothetical protein